MKSSWDQAFDNVVRAIFQPGAHILDIGGGLRVDATRGNVEDAGRAWIKPLMAHVDYKVMDPVDTYSPDVVGDIHAIPLADALHDAVICLSVLEHVPKPWIAVTEMKRILKPGGTLFLHVPFLYPYHAMPGYYGDYFRFSDEGIRSLLEGWDDVTLIPVRGPLETILRLLPGSLSTTFVAKIARWFDARRHSSGKQVSGFYVTARAPSSV